MPENPRPQGGILTNACRKDEQARALAASPHSKSADPARNGRATYGNRAYCSFADAEAAIDEVAVSFVYSALA
jgi:hypothetical protein